MQEMVNSLAKFRQYKVIERSSNKYNRSTTEIRLSQIHNVFKPMLSGNDIFDDVCHLFFGFKKNRSTIQF